MKTPRHLAGGWLAALFLLGPSLDAALWIKGVDVSSLKKSEDLGGVYASGAGLPGDALGILKQGGVNAIRLRVWLNPADGYNNRATTLAMAARAKALGLAVLLDFHYSDRWADPGQQNKPAAWSGHGLEQLKADVYDVTYDLCAALVAQGTPPQYVQVGNEINDGMLWPEGRISTNGNSFANLAQLLNRGIAAVRDASPDTAVVLHIARGAEWGVVQWWFDGVKAQGVTWDYTGVSYYPYWHGALSAFQTTINNAASRYGKPVIVCETAYPFTLAVGDSQANNIGLSSQLVAGYPATEEGQRAMMKAILEIVAAVPGGRGAGIFYWEGTWTPVPGNGWDNTDPASGNSWENQALFDFNGKALGSLSVFSEYAAWPVAAFTALELADVAVSGDEADPDGDGLKNVLEFAFASDPRSTVQAPATFPASELRAVDGRRYLAISFRRPAPPAGVTYTVLTADSPAGPWTADAVMLGAPVAQGDGTETVVFRDSVPSDEPARVRRFMKVEVTHSP